jgi:dihydropteroate synthase
MLDFQQPRVMGVVNVTPDSFSDGGLYLSRQQAISHALSLEVAGADIIDIGGESTRPGSEGVAPDVQIERVVPVIEGIREQSAVPISIDTTSARVANAAITAGASIVNDISAFRFDPEMIPFLVDTKAPAVAMHTLAHPSIMQSNPHYDDVTGEVLAHLLERVNVAVEAGLDAAQIILDPGIGFGKTLAHNLTLLRELPRFLATGHAVLVGTSRKSFLGALVHKDVDDRLAATAASVAVAIGQGVHIVRVHDVAELNDTVVVATAIRHGVTRNSL